MPDTLKPPPKFVHNQWAWAYTLDKLRAKGMLDEGGNPTNYAAASAIYKRVDAKYGDPNAADRQFIPRDLVRAELLECDGALWHVARGSLWAANDVAHMILRHDQEIDAWHIARHTDAGIVDGKLDQGVAEWLVRETPAALEFVRKVPTGAAA